MQFPNFVIRLAQFEFELTRSGYLLLRAVGSESHWHLTLPLVPLAKGPDAGTLRPHLTRRLGNGRAVRRIFDKQSHRLTVAELHHGRDKRAFANATALTWDTIKEWFQKVQAEVEQLRSERARSWVVDDEAFRQMLRAVHRPDRIAPSPQFAADLLDRAAAGERVVFDIEQLVTPELLNQARAAWKPPTDVDDALGSAPDGSAWVRVVLDCGHENEYRVRRAGDGAWELSHDGDVDSEEITAIIERSLPPGVMDAIREAFAQVGVRTVEGHVCEHCADQRAAEPVPAHWKLAP